MSVQALRRRFVLLAIVTLVPVALLVWRALTSVAVERRARHQVVAERLFDEMEQALSTFLGSEEARGFEAWPADAQAPPSDRDFVRAWFQVEPDGRLRTAARPRAELEALWREPATERNERQSPGTTRAMKDGVAQADSDDAKGRDLGVSAYDAIRSLNKAAEQRVARQKKLSDTFEAASAPTQAAEGERAAGRIGTKESELPPLVGRLVDGRSLLLYRTVVRDGRGYRQGLLVDVERLGTWLRAQVLAVSALGEQATLSVAAAGDAPGRRVPATDFVYRHRFAEPFAGLTAEIALGVLPGVGGVGYVYALSAFLVLAMLGSLVALYRMVMVTVAFAERRSNFVAAVSHELKTPLTAIRMYGEMLRDGIVPSEAKRDEYHRHITAESERLSRLVNNVLELSRLEKGTRDMSLVVGPVTPVLEEAATLLRPHVEQAGFTLRVTVDADLPPVRFERDALLQVLFNVVDNAVKYADAAARKEIVVHARAERGGVVLVIRDHGPGVPAEHLAHIFEPFYRGERELTRRSKGTGIGLALVHGLAERMAATVRGRNAPDGGFEVELRFAGAPAG